MELDHFPTPYPDEHFISVLLRHQLRTGRRNWQKVCIELLGKQTEITLAYYHYTFDHLAAVLDESIPADHWITYHSLYPVIGAISGVRSYYNRGLNALSGVPQFCPCCLHEDSERYGEPYWHRIHQLEGVKVCPVHKVLLVNSCPTCQHHLPSAWPLSWKAPCGHELPTRADSPEQPTPRFRALLAIARDFRWLLDQANPDLGRSTMGHYRFLLRSRGYLDCHPDRFVHDIIRHFQTELPEVFENPGYAAYWLSFILREVKCSTAPGASYDPDEIPAWAPIQHLVVIQFLSHSVEPFFCAPYEPAECDTARADDAFWFRNPDEPVLPRDLVHRPWPRSQPPKSWLRSAATDDTYS